MATSPNTRKLGPDEQHCYDIYEFNTSYVYWYLQLNDLTLADLAREIDMNHSQLGKTLNNGYARYKVLDRIACAVGCHPLELSGKRLR